MAYDFYHLVPPADISGSRPHPGNEVTVRRVIVWGGCEYELLGLQTLLEAEGYNVCRPGERQPEANDLFVVALSAGLAVCTGRWLAEARLLRSVLPCRMVVLVPGRMKGLRAFSEVGAVYDGRMQLSSLRLILIGEMAGVVVEESTLPEVEFSFSLKVDWRLIPGMVSEAYFLRLMELSPVRSARLTAALKDWFVAGQEVSELCREYNLSQAYFRQQISHFQLLSRRVAELFPFVLGPEPHIRNLRISWRSDPDTEED